MTYLAAFLTTLIADWFWARYIITANNRLPIIAGAYSAGIVLLGGLTVLLYVGDAWTILPAAAGAFCGTCWGVKRG